MRRVHENETYNLFWMSRSVQLRNPTAVGVSHENIRGFDAGVGEKAAQFVDHVLYAPRSGAGIAPPEADAVIAHHSSQLGEARLELGPAQRRSCQRRIEDDRRCSTAHAPEMESHVSNGDELPCGRMISLFASGRDTMVRERCTKHDQRQHRGSERNTAYSQDPASMSMSAAG
jgi:hypothetical protein